MIEEEKINEVGENPEEEVELTEEDVKKVGEAIKKAQVDATKLSPKNQELFEQIMAQADMPIALQDKDIKLGKQELDVRLLSRANWRQMEFRQLVLQNVYLKQVVMGQTDILRLLMVIAKKLGVEDIIDATEEIENELELHQTKTNKDLN